MAKTALAVAIVLAVSWQFVILLQNPSVRQRLADADPAWLTLSGLLYLLAFAVWCGYWLLVLWIVGEQFSTTGGYRAYYFSQLGKYLPGKAWALLLRATAAREFGTRAGVAGMTSLYEVLTTMTAGALLAILLLSWEALTERSAMWKVGLFVVIVGIPLLPPVFNRLTALFTVLATRAVKPIGGEAPDLSLPRLPPGTLPAGLLITGCGWWIMGLSLWAMLQAVLPEATLWSWQRWTRYTASIAMAYIAGFVVLPVPGGLGVREWVLQRLLANELRDGVGLEEAQDLAGAIAITLRLVWTVAEVFMALLAYCLPVRKSAPSGGG